MSEPSRAVFLSYASQDSEAAKRICDSLRSGGVEVWFDADGGLEHGDEWDGKIRRQIKECLLFLPLISANTQARHEGYFRIEWELAAQRAMGIASGVPFILPVVIDDTREPDALVPDRFRAVQWTRLRGGEVPSDVQQRFLKLWSHRTGVLSHEAARAGDGPGHAAPAGPTAAAKKPVGLYAALAALVLLVAGVALWRPWAGPVPPPSPSVPAAREQSPAAAAEFPRDPELKRAEALIYSLEAIPEDFSLAEDLVKPLAAARPNDPAVATVYAEIMQESVTRGFNTTLARRAQAQHLAERAVQLAPDNPAALGTLARQLSFVNSQLSRAEELIRRAIALDPGEPRFQRTLYGILAATKPEAEIGEYGARMAAAFPQDVLVAYDIARHYKDAGDPVGCETWFDKTIALKPMASALVWKAWLLQEVHGDTAGMKAVLDRVPERQRVTTRVVNSFAIHGIITGQTATAERLLDALGEPWLSDFDFTGPKSLLMGELLHVDGRDDLARVQFEAALAEIQRQEAEEPTNLRIRRAELWALIGLGRRDEARAVLRVVVQSLPQPYHFSLNYSWWSGPVRAALLLGERSQALATLREACTDSTGRQLLRNNFLVDPVMAPFHDDAEISAVLAEPSAGTPAVATPVPVDQKSVAVLAFTNLSDDKNNEYFSDGISEELLNVLAKIPELKVSARTSAFYFKGKEVPVPEIARQLGVAYVVEGSVRKSGDRVRITAQLIKAADGFHLWSDTFTRDLKDIFGVQDEIAGLIAKNLELKMGITPEGVRPAISSEAYQEFLLGRAAAVKASMADLHEAVAHFERAVALEPKYTAAWVQLASAHTQLGRWGGAPTLQAWKAARAAIDQARALEPDSPEVLLALGWILRTSDWDWRGAERAFRRSIELRPNQPDALAGAAVLLFNIGKTDEAFRLGRQAAQLDPLNPATQTDLSIMFYLSSNWAEAERTARRALQLAPGGTSYHSILAWSLIAQQRYDEAEAEAAQDTDEVEKPTALGYLAIVRGQGAAAREQLARLEELSHTRGDSADLQQSIAWLSANLGDKDRAFAALEKARTTRDPSMSWLRNSWYLKPLYSDPRWSILLHQVGLADDQLN